ncbi:uncharacterized protein LOC135694347 [Rhopilema esculentum]|uniref:uncharacterized protein LOC135694347 n=1 Tax=Rhopilema esculentum TaxID=499914 RepID=UPI0031D2AA5C
MNEMEFTRTLNVSHNEWIHVQVCKRLVDVFDSVNDVDQFAEVERELTEPEYSLNFPEIKEMNFSGKPFVCIKPCDSQYGVVSVNRMGFVCCTCSIVRSACVHVGCLKEMLHKENESLPVFILEMESLRYDIQQTGPKPNCYLPKAMSACKVTWKTTPCQQKIYNF